MQNITTNNLVAAIDLGTSKICGAVGRKDYNGRVEIIAFESMDSKGIKRGTISNLESAAFCIKRILELLQNKINILFNEGKEGGEKKIYEIIGVYVGLNGHTIKTMNSNVPRNLGEIEVPKEIIQELYEENHKIKIENDEILEIVTQEYLVDDSEEMDPVGCICTRIEGRYKIIAGRPSLKNNLNKCFERAGYKITDTFLSPVATASAVLTKEEKELGCAMIDFGAGTTSVAVYYKNILRHACVIPLGSDTITKDIMDLKVLEADAEKLKVKYGSTMEELVKDFQITIRAVAGKEAKNVSSKFLAGIIEARMDDILHYISEQIKKSGFASHIDGLVITGGGSRLSNLTEKLKLRTGWDVRYGAIDQNIGPDMNEKYLKAEYAQLIGLLIHADKPCLQEKNESNQEETENKGKKKGNKSKEEPKEGGGLWGFIEKFIKEDSKI